MASYYLDIGTITNTQKLKPRIRTCSNAGQPGYLSGTAFSLSEHDIIL